MRMMTPSRRYLLALIVTVSVNYLPIMVVSEDVSGKVGGSQLYLPIKPERHDECIDVTCINELSLDACEIKAYEMAGNMFTFDSTHNKCCIKSCGSKIYNNTPIYSVDIVPQSGYSMYIYNRDGGGKKRAKRYVNWQSPVQAGLKLLPTLVRVGLTAPLGPGIATGVSAATTVVVVGISQMINMLSHKEDTYEQIRQQVLHDIRNEIAADKVHTMKRQLENWEDGTFFRFAGYLNIRAISYDRLHEKLIKGDLENLVVNDNNIREYDELIDQLVILQSDVDLKQNVFKLTNHYVSSLAYYHDYAALDVYILSMLIIAKRDTPVLQATYRDQLLSSAENHYNYLMFLIGKRLIYDGQGKL